MGCGVNSEEDALLPHKFCIKTYKIIDLETKQEYL